MSKLSPQLEASLSAQLNPEVSIDQISSLEKAQKCAPIYILLKELVRAHIDEFFIKMAMLLQLSSDPRKIKWRPQELLTEFYWLQEDVIKRTVQQLSRSGWLSFEQGEYQISTFGKTILSIITALPEEEDVIDSLGANISSMSLSELYESNPDNVLRMFLNELSRVDSSILQTLKSSSEYLVRKLSRRVRSQFNVAVKSREFLKNISSKDFASYRLKQEIHEKLSNFHSRVSQVQRAQNDLVARKIILADRSLTQHDISAFLINTSVEKLANLGRSFIASPVKIPDLIPSLMVYETEWQMEKNSSKEERRGWGGDAEEASESKDNLTVNNRFLQLATEVEHKIERQGNFTLEEFVPADSWDHSAFRFAMIAVLESSELPAHLQLDNENSCPQLEVSYLKQEENFALAVAELNNPFSGVKEITRGIVSKKEKQKEETNTSGLTTSG